MKTYGIETHWNGTQIYVIGQCKNKKEAYKAAKDGYKWFRLNPNFKAIVEVKQ